MEFLILLIVIIIIGALLGGKSFGGTIRNGCGFLIVLVILGIAAVVFISLLPDSEKSYENQEAISTVDKSVYFIVKDSCQTYSKPDIESDVSGNLEVGNEFFVKDVSKFNYFYELNYENGKKAFVKKECLKRK